ncbi:MAG: NUDIX hydrolase [Candidatus Pacebacteria bacterium]|nr:NUDIX hydrolase [Candidatus Paceibacterota bacterium]
MEVKKIGESSDGREMHYSAGVIIECKGKYLLLDRINPPFGLACPAGHIDAGEEPKVACLRELKEETGIILEDVEFICEEEIFWNYCKSVEVHYWYLYKAQVESESVTLEKEGAKSIGWYSAEEMKTLNLEKVWEYWLKKLGVI